MLMLRYVGSNTIFFFRFVNTVRAALRCSCLGSAIFNDNLGVSVIISSQPSLTLAAYGLFSLFLNLKWHDCALSIAFLFALQNRSSAGVNMHFFLFPEVE